MGTMVAETLFPCSLRLSVSSLGTRYGAVCTGLISPNSSLVPALFCLVLMVLLGKEKGFFPTPD